ncbi:hypothetical protein V6N11_074625 [Hibiscus sabdariffa]|uniref:Uncharacterized protein n=1 Tax=Hibiscus sabdariffa TaxID=183260 RepID=A0ABR2R429_9ROSI
MKKVRSSVDVVVDSDRVAMDADHGTGMDSDVRDADVSSPSLPQEQGQCTAPSMGDGGTYASKKVQAARPILIFAWYGSWEQLSDETAVDIVFR